jgi:hypothetical protein
MGLNGGRIAINRANNIEIIKDHELHLFTLFTGDIPTPT